MPALQAACSAHCFHSTAVLSDSETFLDEVDAIPVVQPPCPRLPDPASWDVHSVASALWDDNLLRVAGDGSCMEPKD